MHPVQYQLNNAGAAANTGIQSGAGAVASGATLVGSAVGSQIQGGAAQLGSQIASGGSNLAGALC